MATELQFRQLEDEYYRLKGQYAAGRIDRDQFAAQLKNLMLQDAEGRWWTINADTGRWCVNNGRDWVDAAPPYAPSSPAGGPTSAGAQRPLPPQARSGCGCWQIIGCGCLALVVLIVAGCGGGWLALKSGAITRDSVLSWLGQGPGDMRVMNYTDDSLYVRVTRFDAPKDETPIPTNLELNAFDIKTHHIQDPGRYRVEFGTRRGESDAGVCTLSVRSGDDYQFVALPGRIAVTRANNPSPAGADYVVETSSLCR